MFGETLKYSRFSRFVATLVNHFGSASFRFTNCSLLTMEEQRCEQFITETAVTAATEEREFHQRRHCRQHTTGKNAACTPACRHDVAHRESTRTSTAAAKVSRLSCRALPTCQRRRHATTNSRDWHPRRRRWNACLDGTCYEKWCSATETSACVHCAWGHHLPKRYSKPIVAII